MLGISAMKKANLLRMLGVGVLSVAGVGWTFVNLRTAYERRYPPTTEPASVVADWQAYAGAGQRLGPKSAIVTVVVFSDYQCSFCAAANRILRDLRARYPTSLAEVIRHYPLPEHRAAADAARAAVCADGDGRFESFNDRLFSGADSIGSKSLASYAIEAGIVDTLAFRLCVTAAQTDTAVANDLAAGRRLRANRTPTLLVNNEMYEGLPPDLDRVVARKIAAEVRARRQ